MSCAVTLTSLWRAVYGRQLRLRTTLKSSSISHMIPKLKADVQSGDHLSDDAFDG